MRAIWMDGKLPRVGTPIFTFPNTPPASTTTTTVPDDGCGLLPTYGSVRCRLEQLAATIGASDAGPLASRLTMRIKSAAAAVAHAEQSWDDVTAMRREPRSGRPARASPPTASSSLRRRRCTLSDETRSALEAPLGGLRATVQALPTSP